jgi:hypothetical protein
MAVKRGRRREGSEMAAPRVSPGVVQGGRRRRVPGVDIENVKENELLTNLTVSMLSAGFSFAEA